MPGTILQAYSTKRKIFRVISGVFLSCAYGTVSQTPTKRAVADLQWNRIRLFSSFFNSVMLVTPIMGSILKGQETGNLVNFPRAEHKPLELEIYLLNRKIAVRPPEKQYLTVICEVLYFSSISKNSIGKGELVS